MIQMPMDILHQFPVRKTKKQKQAFREAVCSYTRQLGYPVSEEKGSFGACNIVIGQPEKATYLVTAHYDTCTRMLFPNYITPCNVPLYLLYQLGIVLLFVVVATVFAVFAGLLFGKESVTWISYAVYCILLLLMVFGPANRNNANDNTSGVIVLMEIIRTLPENQRHKVCFVLFDLEEAGLIGSASYRKAHKTASDRQIVLNLDCVGDGDHIMMLPTKKLLKDRKKLTSLYRACGYFGKKSLLLHEKGLHIYPSDQKHFPYGVGICALQKRKKLLYLSRIHTSKDTVLEETNINILRAALTSYICCDAAQ